MIEVGMKTPPADGSTAVTAKYTEAFNLNARIRISAQMAQQNLYEVCKGLKEMRDGKLYKELGYQNFEDYCENEVGISREHARRYITIIEQFGENATSMWQIGATKLMLLAKLDEPQREEIQQTTDLESVSVRELKNQIEELKAGSDKLKSENITLADKLDTTNKECIRVGQQRGELINQRDRLKEQVSELESQIQELESRPVEVAVQVDTEEVEKLKSILKQTDLDWAQKYNEMEDENVKLRRADFQKHAAEIERLKKEYEEKLASIPQPEAVPDTKEVFKAYLANAVDSANRLLGFITKHNDELFISKAKEFFNTVTNKLEV